MVKQVNRAGVIHFDCQPRNILVADIGQGAAFQPYLIDFAQCGFRADYRDTEDLDDERGFAHHVHSRDNHGAVAVLMTQRIARITPFSIHVKSVE